MDPLFLPFIWNGVTSASLANPSVFVAQVYSILSHCATYSRYILPHWPPPTCEQHTEQWKTPITEGREFYLSASPVEMLFQRLRSVLKHLCNILWVWMFWTWWFGAESFCMATSTFLLLVHKGCQGFHSCLVLPSICQHVPTVDWEFDLEPLIRKNLMALSVLLRVLLIPRNETSVSRPRIAPVASSQLPDGSGLIIAEQQPA